MSEAKTPTRTPSRIIGDDAFVQLVFEGYEVVPALFIETMRAALVEAQELAKLTATMTGCRGDDGYVWGVQERIDAALSKATSFTALGRVPGAVVFYDEHNCPVCNAGHR